MYQLLAATAQSLTLVVTAVALIRLFVESKRENRRQGQRNTVTFITSTIQRQHEMYERIYRDKSVFQDAADGSDQHYLLTSYMSYLEYLSAAVNMGVLDKDVVDKMIGGRLIRAWYDFDEWIVRQRDDLRNDAVYRELQQLVLKLKPRVYSGTAPQAHIPASGEGQAPTSASGEGDDSAASK